MYFQAKANNINYEIRVAETRKLWKVGLKPDGQDWIQYDFSKGDYQHLDEAISFIFNNSSYLIDVVKDGLDFTVYTRGSYRNIEIYNEEKLLHESLKSGKGMGSDSSLTSGMPGKITKIYVKPGQAVKANDPLLIMEAMKMENEMRATSDTTIDKVHVKEGENVEGGTMLISYKDEK